MGCWYISVSIIPFNQFTLWLPQESIVCYSHTFENNLRIKLKSTKYLKESCLAFDQHFPFKGFCQKMPLLVKYFQNLQACFGCPECEWVNLYAAGGQYWMMQKNLMNDRNPGKWVLIWEYSARAIQWIQTRQGLVVFQNLCNLVYGQK